MSPTTETATASEVDPSRSKPTSAETRIHWAESAVVRKAEDVRPDPAVARKAALEEKFEAMRARNWITERMVHQYQKHWNCTREAALERLMSKSGV